jgi:hypothetical protein
MKRVELLVVVVMGVASRTFGFPVVDLLQTQAIAQQVSPTDYSQLGLFMVDVRVGAVDNDVWMTASIGHDTGKIRDSFGVELLANTLIVSSLSPGSDFPWYQVPQGTSRDFRFWGSFTPPITGVYHFELAQLPWTNTKGGPGQFLKLDDTFRTESIFLPGVPEPATLMLLGASSLVIARRRRA